VLYLLDANVLIDANRDYYPLERVPEFWDWLIRMGTEDNVKVPYEIYEEINAGTDALAKWAKDKDVSEALVLKEDADQRLVADVINVGYASDLNDIEIETVGRDPLLIAYARADVGSRTIVTTEHSKPTKQRANRHVPDVCAQLKFSA